MPVTQSRPLCKFNTWKYSCKPSLRCGTNSGLPEPESVATLAPRYARKLLAGSAVAVAALCSVSVLAHETDYHIRW